ncbi:MAG: hypothetical protein R3C56_22730 [Pirellulaceae bacterium]
MSLSFAPRGLLALAAILYVVSLSLLRADGPNDNQPGKVRQVPPPGIELSREVRAELLADVERQRKRLLELAHPALPPSEQRKRELCEVLSRGADDGGYEHVLSRRRSCRSAELLKLGAERLEKLDAGASELELLERCLRAKVVCLSHSPSLVDTAHASTIPCNPSVWCYRADGGPILRSPCGSTCGCTVEAKSSASGLLAAAFTERRRNHSWQHAGITSLWALLQRVQVRWGNRCH